MDPKKLSKAEMVLVPFTKGASEALEFLVSRFHFSEPESFFYPPECGLRYVADTIRIKVFYEYLSGPWIVITFGENGGDREVAFSRDIEKIFPQDVPDELAELEQGDCDIERALAIVKLYAPLLEKYLQESDLQED